MNDEQLPALGGSSFESLKDTNRYGAEYWSARDLQPLLGYEDWHQFEKVIQRAITSCKKSGNRPEAHFTNTNTTVQSGKGASRRTKDYRLSRFACYLIAQNGDPCKPEIARSQKYLALQTRRQEFHDAGYKALYGGLDIDAVKARKNIPVNESLNDRMSAVERAAHNFLVTQTRDKLARENIRSHRHASQVHEEVGQTVRQAMHRMGGTLPENIPPAEHIKQVQRRAKGKGIEKAISQ